VADALLIDNSAWARLAQPRLPRARAAEVAQLADEGRLASCAPFLLEAGYSARDAREHAALLDDLSALPLLPIDDTVERRAVAAQAQLARRGHHRLPPVDLLMGAIAERHNHGVLHYDRDFDLLVEQTDLAFESVWLAGRGTL